MADGSEEAPEEPPAGENAQGRGPAGRPSAAGRASLHGALPAPVLHEGDDQDTGDDVVQGGLQARRRVAPLQWGRQGKPPP